MRERNNLKKSVYVPMRIDAETDEQLNKIAVSQKKAKSDVMRDLIDKGLKADGYKPDDERLYNMIKKAMEEVSKPQVNRLAAISAKAAHIVSAVFFLLVYIGKLLLPEDDKHIIDEVAEQSRRLGIEYLRLKDSDIDGFIKRGVHRVDEEL